MKQIAIIDDDQHINDMLYEVLTHEGYNVIRAYSGTEAVYMLSGNSKPDLILLDLMLPGISGEELLKSIKGIPVMVVSAKLDVKNKVNLLLDGAVDYITKPFDIEELLARITVQLRKNETAVSNELQYSDLTLDMNTHLAIYNGANVKLTKTEYAILKLLMQNPNQVITKTAMLDSISEDTPDCVENSLKVHISNLRKKLRDLSGKEYIEAVWGIGFKMA